MKTKLELIDNLSKVIEMYKGDKDVRKFMQNCYIEKNLVVTTVNAVLKSNLPLSSLNQIELGIWCIYLNEVTKENKLLKPTEYFTDLEIQKIKEYYNADTRNTKVNKIVLHDVVKKKNQYLCPFISNYDIFKYWNNRLLVYNFDTQRDPRITKHKETIVKQANINWNSVKDIAKDVLADEFTANLITWNIRKTSSFAQKGVVYNEKDKTLTITPNYETGKEVYIDIIDGFHRTLATLDAVEQANIEGKHLEYGFMLSITNFTVREAQDHIRREDKHNPIDKEYSQSLEKDDYNTFVDTLNGAWDSSTNKMKDKIGSTLDEVVAYKKYTTVNILHDAFRLSELKFDEPFTNEMYLAHFIDVFNTILGYYTYKYEGNIDELKKETIVLEPNAFAGYVAIGKELLNKDNKKELLKSLLETNKIDLARGKKEWETIDMYKKTPKSYKKIYEYFKANVVIE